ncbi:MAG: molybdopterin molybdotransferase MoeA [Ginsengibacter sp.]
MISVKEAENIILNNSQYPIIEMVSIDNAIGRTLAEKIYADRDMPPFNRATVDGIAVSAKNFNPLKKVFKIKGIQAAGDVPIRLENNNECVEIMTGAAVHDSADAVIRYEDLIIDNGFATLQIDKITAFQGIHKKGIDQIINGVLISPNIIIDPVAISILASVGKSEVKVFKLPKVAIISTGDELVDINTTPSPFQIRKSNNYMLAAALRENKIEVNTYHLSDNEETIKGSISTIMKDHDVLIISGGISMGKFDFIPNCLEKLGATILFHKIKQRPGKPFLFASMNNKLIFGLPGNPVSSFFCLIRYIYPWIRKTVGIQNQPLLVAELTDDIAFGSDLDYFVPVSVNASGNLKAKPFEGNGSGDFANLLSANAFMEFPAEQNKFAKGNLYNIYPFNFQGLKLS